MQRRRPLNVCLVAAVVPVALLLAGCAGGRAGPAAAPAAGSPTLSPDTIRDRDRVGTEIEFVLERAQDVTVTVRDLDGTDVAVVYQGLLPAGAHLLVWDGRSEAGREARHGTYLASVEAVDYSRTVRLTYSGVRPRQVPGGVAD
ncbi:MAG: FlgD immunoglobulin-like domain containing protein [Candidatus Krumholzibacteriia bacterium]